MLDIMLKFLTNYGFPIGFVAFFIYRDYMREKDLTAKIRSLESQIQGILQDTLMKTTNALIKNNTFMLQLLKALSKRPCIAEEIEEPEHEDQNIAV